LPEPHPDTVNRMSLEQRKAYRQEMLYQALREAFLSIEVISSMYKFKVMPVDVGHHRFIAMVDVAMSFVSGPDTKTKSFADLEKRMRSYAFNRYGVLITGVYWRVSETPDEFHHQTRAADSTNPQAASLIHSRRNPSEGVARHGFPGSKLARASVHPVSAEERQAFMDALSQGVTPPGMHVGDLEYRSDLAPLDDGIMIGGTQYGKLQ
jgi:hypothetical protein